MQERESTQAAALPPDLAREFAAARGNGCVGTRLLSQDARCRVWTIVLAPGARLGFHTHVLDYFWTAVTAGRARSHHGDGRVSEVEYRAGDIRHLSFGPGEFMTHDLTNVGGTGLIFTTVEFLDGANPPLDLPDAVRAQARYPEGGSGLAGDPGLAGGSGGTAVCAITTSGSR